MVILVVSYHGYYEAHNLDENFSSKIAWTMDMGHTNRPTKERVKQVNERGKR